MEKRQSKATLGESIKSIIERRVRVVYFEMVSPLTIEECITRLSKIQFRVLLQPIPIKVEIICRDEEDYPTYEFFVNRGQSTEANGRFVLYPGATSIHVEGQVSNRLILLLLSIFLWLLGLVILPTMIPQYIQEGNYQLAGTIAAFALFALIFAWSLNFVRRYQLLRAIYVTLQAHSYHLS